MNHFLQMENRMHKLNEQVTPKLLGDRLVLFLFGMNILISFI